MTPAPHSNQIIHEQVERIARHPLFAASERLIRFLRFTVEAALEGRAAGLKEYVIGTEVYERKPPYDPRIDSVVRVEARRLRTKLKRYYETDGRSSVVRIEYKPGSYAPSFVRNIHQNAVGNGGDEELFTDGAGASVAIMPFIALNKSDDDEAFADGLTDEIIYLMSRSPGFRVIARSSIFQYKNRPFSAAELTQKFAVQAVVQGTVRRSRDRFRVTVELSGADGYVVWSERFEANDSEYFRLQEQIAAALVSRCRLDVPQMRAMHLQPSPVALQAFGKVCLARQLIDSQTSANLSTALELLQEVTQATPQYGRALSGLSDCYMDLYRMGRMDRSVAFPAARSAAQRALEIDPTSVEARCALGVLSLMEWNWARAEEYLHLSESAGSNARATRFHAVYLTVFERYEECQHQLNLAKKVDPFSIQHRLATAMCLFQARQYDAVIEEVGTECSPTDPVEIHIYTALAHIFRGSRSDAVTAVVAVQKLAAGQTRFKIACAELSALVGDTEAAVALRHVHSAAAESLPLALLSAALGDQSAALEFLESAVERHEPQVAFLSLDPRFDSIRGTARFAAIRSRLGLPAATLPSVSARVSLA